MLAEMSAMDMFLDENAQLVRTATRESIIIMMIVGTVFIAASGLPFYVYLACNAWGHGNGLAEMVLAGPGFYVLMAVQAFFSVVFVGAVALTWWHEVPDQILYDLREAQIREQDKAAALAATTDEGQ